MNLAQYILRRLLYAIPILLGTTLIIFVLFNLVGGDPAALLLGQHPSAEQIAAINEELGLNKPYYMQYLDTVKSAFTFDFGRSWATKQNINDMIVRGAVPSLTLTVPAFIISLLFSISLALLVSYFRGKFIDRFFVVICITLTSISSLCYILFGQWFFAYRLNLFEISGYEYGFPNFVPYVILPGIIWVVLTVGPDLRFFRTVILDEIYQDYVRTARSKGLTEKVILFKHVLKNAMIPIITYVVIQLPFLILGALLLENFFSIPGLGNIIVDAINSADFPVLKAMTILTTILYIVFNLITDILYTVADPRVRLK